MKCVLKLANVMIVMFLAVIVCGVPLGDSPLANSESSKTSSESPNQSISSTINSQTSSKSKDASGSVGHVETSSNKTNTPVSVGCKVEPCSSDGNGTVKSNVPSSIPSHEMSSQAEVQATDNSKEFSRKMNPEALKRGFFVFAGLSVIVLMYIAWKSFGKRPTQVHRYGVITNHEDLEMAPLDSDDGEGDEDDTTHFDISKHRPK